MKKAVHILLLSVFLFSSAGYYILFQVEYSRIKSELKRTLKQNLREDQLTIFTFNEKEVQELRWKEDHEFYFNDNLYDVVKVKKSDTLTVYYCINDTQEEQLFEDLDQMIAKNSDAGNPKSKEIKNAKVLFHSDIDRPRYFIAGTSCSYQHLFENYQFINKNTDSPPPRLS